MISINTIEENIFKKSLQKRELGGLIIEGSFDVEMFSKVSMKDMLSGVSSLIPKPKKKDLMKEENIVFHHHTHKATEFMTDPNKELTTKDGQVDNQESAMLELERMREIEAYRRRFEEAMIRIEDQEDVEAYNEAKAEIDDEFDEDADVGVVKNDKKEETRASGIDA